MTLEQTLIFGAEHHLVGTHTQAQAAIPALSRTLLLLTNAGVIPRVGPHRFNLHLARACAHMGLSSLRFDLSGLGDSRRSSTRLSSSRQFVADTRAAMDLAREQFNCERFVMLGICSGGDLAQLVALEDERLEALVLFDAYIYPTRWARLRGMAHRLRFHGMRAVLAELWRRLVQRHDGPAVTTASTDVPGNYGRSTVPPVEEFGQRIRALLDRGVKILFVYSGGTPAWFNYHRQFRDMFGAQGFVDRVDYVWLPQVDHSLTQPRTQQALIEHVQTWLRKEVVPTASATTTAT